MIADKTSLRRQPEYRLHGLMPGERRGWCVVIIPPHTSPPSENAGHLPLVDDAALSALLASLDQDEHAVDGFVDTFIEHWPERLRKAERSIAAQDQAAIYDCALSIKVSSQMVGALRLGTLGSDLERLVRSGRLDGAVAILQALGTVGEQTIQALGDARGRHYHAA
jgi:HPt (histidine-containing phosphotransfer) domain-containing protein